MVGAGSKDGYKEGVRAAETGEQTDNVEQTDRRVRSRRSDVSIE